MWFVNKKSVEACEEWSRARSVVHMPSFNGRIVDTVSCRWAD